MFWGWVACAILFLRNTILPRLSLTVSPSQFGLPGDIVRFHATDGVPLEGWKIPGAPDQPWIIGCHGMGSNRADLLEIASGLHQAGLNVFLFDFRGHGGSRGRTTSFGLTEQRDLHGALAFLGRQPDVPARPYGVYGISMGGAVGLIVAAQDQRLGAVAADSPYSNLEASISRHLGLMYPWLPAIPFQWFTASAYRMRFGCWPRQVSPASSMARLNRPLLLIQGGRDPRMPVRETKAMFASAASPKDLWVVEQAGHLESYATDPNTYQRKLTKFFTANLTE